MKFKLVDAIDNVKTMLETVVVELDDPKSLDIRENLEELDEYYEKFSTMARDEAYRRDKKLGC